MHLFMGFFIKENVKPQKGRIMKFRSKRNFGEQHYKQDLCHALWHVGEIFYKVEDRDCFWEALMASIVDGHLPVK